MGIDWEEILGAEGDELADAYEARIEEEERASSPRPVTLTDYCTGIWQGRNIRFKKIFSNHTFTAEECEKLLKGEVISFSAVSKKGKLYTAKGKLADLNYNGHNYVGFKFVD